MSRHSFARALISILVALFLSSTVTSAEAKPLRWKKHHHGGSFGAHEIAARSNASSSASGIVLEDWTICPNGATLSIGADVPILTLIARSQGRVLYEQPLLELNDEPLSIRYQWPRQRPPTVTKDTPYVPPRTFRRPVTFRYSTTIKLWWPQAAGPKFRLAIGPVGGRLSPGILRVGKCLLLPNESFNALTAWLGKLSSLPWAPARG